MDAYLAVVSKREVRRYEDRPVREDVLRKILEAGRATGSSKNSQPWRFIVCTGRPRLRELAPLVSAPRNIEGCAAAIAVAILVGRGGLDGGRVAQNMMIAAWSLGVGTCPNSPRDQAAMRQALGLPDDAVVPTIVSLGYPGKGEPRPPKGTAPEEVLARVKRLPFEELVHRERYRS
ncbi:MAG: nitroreductase family protein [Candidatus Limnocylindria bacterium]